jgi:Fe-S oxidoreductase
MNPVAMTLLLVALVTCFGVSFSRRWALVRAGTPTPTPRTDRVGERLRALWTLALAQKKMRYYRWAGLAHQLIFIGFVVLLCRSLLLFGRGFAPAFNLGLLGPDGWAGVGELYGFVKDLCVILVLLGVGVFSYYRVIRPQRRMTLNAEGLLILGIIAAMMLADVTYDGAATALNIRHHSGCTASVEWCGRAAAVVAPLGPPIATGWRLYPDPAGSAAAALFGELGIPTLVVLAHLGFWTHVTLVLVFLNLLPYSKHFHVLTAAFNVFLGDLGPFGRLVPLAQSSERLLELVERASETDDLGAAPVGYGRLGHLSWKDRLDLFTCTECGRCTDNCPASLTGKRLSPKQFTLDLRRELVEGSSARDLVPDVVHPDVVWACTTCRACEEQCPVSISYVDKLVALRRHLVTIRGEAFPPELGRLFDALETNGNPWNLPRADRAKWADGLGVPRAREHGSADLLLWVGCQASYDPRGQKVARALVRLLQAARVDFAMLGEEEGCTGDAARRAGNEHLFLTLAERNLATLGRHGIRRIVTLCPHCENTLTNEYPDLGGKYSVTSHVALLEELVRTGRLRPDRPVPTRVVYHDSCYLGRYAGQFGAPRRLLDALPGAVRVEPERWTRQHGLCCGAGGAQMWLEEQNAQRINGLRVRQLVGTGADTLASACPFCLAMLGDGVTQVEEDPRTRTLDVAELLAQACGLAERATA